jgi:hypothetical protein
MDSVSLRETKISIELSLTEILEDLLELFQSSALENVGSCFQVKLPLNGKS